jgi:glycosyltransferase involved in cell wall biosynthesis
LIVHVGAALPGDADVLFEAMAAVGRALPAAKLALVGGYRGRVDGDATASGRVIRTGFVTRAALATWVCAADVCVIPLGDNVANRGRWPGKVNEYLSAGRATVMSRVGDAAEALAEWGAGWACAPGADALAAALIDALRDAEARAAAEARARELARTALAWPRLAAALDEFHAAVVDAARGG